MRPETLGNRPGVSLRGGWEVWWMGQAPAMPSGREWQGSQSCQGVTGGEPTLWQMQSEAALERAVRPGRSVVWWMGQAPATPSGQG